SRWWDPGRAMPLAPRRRLSGTCSPLLLPTSCSVTPRWWQEAVRRWFGAAGAAFLTMLACCFHSSAEPPECHLAEWRGGAARCAELPRSSLLACNMRTDDCYMPSSQERQSCSRQGLGLEARADNSSWHCTFREESCSGSCGVPG